MHPVTRAIIDRTPPRLRKTVELVVATIDDTFHDRVPGLAAEVAFFVLLSLPPLLLTLLAGIGVVGEWFDATWQADLRDAILDGAALVFSSDTIEETIRPLLGQLVEQSSGSVFGIGFLLTFVSASRALRVISTAITIAYDLESTRKGWQQRLWGFALTLGGIVVGIGLIPLLLAGPGLGAAISEWLGGVPGLDAAYRFLYWPILGTVMTLLIAVLYHLAAPWWTPFHRDLPGALVAMLLWLAGSAGLRIYVGETIASDAIYQPIAGPLVVLLWLYVSGFAVLLGAELNAEIEKLWPTQEHLEHRRHRGFVAAGDNEAAGPSPDAEPTMATPTSPPAPSPDHPTLPGVASPVQAPPDASPGAEPDDTVEMDRPPRRG